MYGTLYFDRLSDLADFLAAFSETGATDKFSVEKYFSQWRLTFEGGK